MKNTLIIAVLLSLSTWIHAQTTITNVDYHSAREIAVTFSEAVNSAQALVPKNYILSGTGKGSLAASPTSVILDSGDTYRMTWAAGEMVNGGLLTVKFVPLNITGTSAGTAQGVLPNMVNFVVTGPRSMAVVFNEKMKDATVAANYTLSGSGLGTLASRPSAVALASASTNSVQYNLTWTTGELVSADMVSVVSTAKDLAGNVLHEDFDSASANTGSFSIAPKVSKVAVTGLRTVDVTFSEVMKSDGGVTEPSNYTVSGTGVGTLNGNPDSVVLTKPTVARLTWDDGEMLTAKDITITVSDATDLVGNSVNPSFNVKTHAKGGKGAPPTILSFDAKSPYVIDVQVSEPLLFPTVNQYFVLSGTGKGTLAMYPDSHTDLGNNWYRLEWDSSLAMVGNGTLTIGLNYCTDAVGHLCKAVRTQTNAGYGVDPFFTDQWHLSNTGQFSGTSGEDVNVVPVWSSCEDNTCRGEGVRIAVVDDGMELAHEDLKQNVVAGGSFNYVTKTTALAYSTKDKYNAHGQAVAGIIAARDNNGIGVKGVAPRASLVGYNFLMKGTEANLLNAMTRNASLVSISSNSWGPADGYGLLDASGSTWKTAVTTGLTTGRTGLGTIYVWAAGNGFTGSSDCPQCEDSSNYDGYANYRGVMAVGAVNNLGEKSSYSEWGANLWVSAPGGEFCDTNAITTTDRTGAVGINISDATTGPGDYTNRNYTKCMNGTSAATPVVSGVTALVLQANPNLGWRDVRYILAKTARKNDASDDGWADNGASVPYNHKYGFGVVDADAAVTMAAAYETNLDDEVTFTTAVQNVNTAIPDEDNVGISETVAVASSGISNLEWVEITFTAADHTFSGDLKVTLTSPSGTISTLALPHFCVDGDCTPYSQWVFSSAAFLDEAADGDWILTVTDETAGDTGTLQSFKLKFFGH
jgi:proprotein convertase subtilisin/kexin type 2